MIPQFPEFKPLEYNDRQDIENIANSFPVYSDFNFTSLHIWNVANEMQVSRLNENLVVRFSDYVTGEPFLSFLGTNDPAHTAQCLIAYSDAQYGLPMLKLIPDTVAKLLPATQFCITSDRDAFDYIYPISFFKSLAEQPSKYKPAMLLRQSLKMYSYSAMTVHFGVANTNIIQAIFKKWACNKGVNYKSLHEFMAFERLLNSSNENIFITTIAISDIQVGFMINEIINQQNAICHFYKADVSYRGIYEALLWEAAKMLDGASIEYLNFEQDLGIEALRRSKGKYKQHSFLKKHTVSMK